MEPQEISHREIYDRLLIVEASVKKLQEDTAGMVEAFNAAKGAFTVLEWLAKIAKPLIVVATFLAAFGAYWSNK